MKLVHLNSETRTMAVDSVDGHEWTDTMGIEIQTSDGNGVYRLCLDDTEALALSSRLVWIVSRKK